MSFFIAFSSCIRTAEKKQADLLLCYYTTPYHIKLLKSQKLSCNLCSEHLQFGVLRPGKIVKQFLTYWIISYYFVCVCMQNLSLIICSLQQNKSANERERETERAPFSFGHLYDYMFPSGNRRATFAYFCSCKTAHRRKICAYSTSSFVPTIPYFLCVSLNFQSDLRLLFSRQEMLLYPQKWMQNNKKKYK